MPIADIELVCESRKTVPEPGLAQELANELGRVLSSPPGSTWVRVKALAREHYAENEIELAVSELPVFVTLLLAQPPTPETLEQQVAAVTAAVARVLRRPEDRVHVEYAPAASGRQAFGGRLLR